MPETSHARAKELRRKTTREENHLWYDYLRDYPARFRRQAPIGPYVADFYCPGALLVVELDGGQHYEDAGQARDQRRSEYLRYQHGVEVIRFSNLDVKSNFEEVCAAIDQAVKRRIKERGRGETTPSVTA